MGLIAKECVLIGLFVGSSTSKTGKHFLSIVSPGPKIHKVQVEEPVKLLDGVEFGTPVTVTLFYAEQKFQDFNGSFTSASSVAITINKSVTPISKAVNS